MKHQYKIVYYLNGKLCFSIFNYNTEEEMKEKGRQWKERTMTTYNNVKVVWSGELTDQDYNYPPPKKIRKSKLYRVYARLMDIVYKIFPYRKKIGTFVA